MLSALRNLRLGKKTPNPIPIQIPEGLDIEKLMRNLMIGHQYEWLILVRDPVLVASGIAKSGSMPELMLVRRTLWIREEDRGYIKQLEHLFKIIN